MKIFGFGSSLVSCYWNGAATYYRGVYKNLARRGHEVTFAEPDAYDRQAHRDAGDFFYAQSIVYRSPEDIGGLLQQARAAGLVVKHSGIGVDDALLEQRVLECRSADTSVAFWDVDAPATLTRVEQDAGDPFRALIPEYDFIFTYGGGASVAERYRRLGAKNCHAIYNGLDPETHHPVAADAGLACDLALVANRLPDRERRIEQFFLRAAELAPELAFLLGGEGWGTKRLPANVRWLGHVPTGDHNRVNCSARIVLNVNRDSMADAGFSPPTRIFEAAGAGACVVTDAWTGVEQFFTPGEQILVASSAEDVVRHLRETSRERTREVGAAMRARALREHTYDRRARAVEGIVMAARAAAEVAA
ncbi:MAG: glycosyltransferase [Candidatus Koribacter versatilis]|uniref:Glycosyltransferase n=1 Tax=Candidatus Korobacter versatilis TaxID=658062 RepID=A0A932EPQ3_9BACT|nr:glycosyltransferase [Candidatus Koribacter versatilis]